MFDPMASSNVRMDPKHDLPLSVAEPQTHDSSKPLEVMRCLNGCGALWTEYELSILGKCPQCGNRKFNRAYPKKGMFGLPSYERLRIIFWDVLKNWRVYGPHGHGWDRARRNALPPA